jgi:hypothetical protein
VNLLVVTAIIGLVLAFVRSAAREGRSARERVRREWAKSAERAGLRFVDDRTRGMSARGQARGVDYVIARTQLRLGEWWFCATARTSSPQRMVIHHRDFDRPSVAVGSLPELPSDDARFDRAFVIRAKSSRLAPEIRAALMELPCPELTVLDGRLAIVWAMTSTAPRESELAAVRALIEQLAPDARTGAYR